MSTKPRSHLSLGLCDWRRHRSAHVTQSARDDAALLHRHLYIDEDISHAARLVPHAVFTDPEVASFGHTEPQAHIRHGDRVMIGKERFSSVVKARAIGETSGFVKILTGSDRQLVGATSVGPDAANLSHELVIRYRSHRR